MSRQASKQVRDFRELTVTGGRGSVSLEKLSQDCRTDLLLFYGVSVTTGIDQAWPVMGPTGDSIIHFDGKSIHILNYGEDVLAYT